MSLKLEGRAGRSLLTAAPWLFFVVLILLWELVCQGFSLPAYVLPAPSAIVEAFFNVEMTRWFTHLWATLRVALMGFAVSILVAIPMAIAMMRSELLTRTLFPLLVVIQSTPVVAVAPLIIVLMGSDDPSRVLITSLLTFFPLVVSTATGINETPEELVEFSRSLDAPLRRETWQIRIPYAVPHIFSGLRVAITLALQHRGAPIPTHPRGPHGQDPPRPPPQTGHRRFKTGAHVSPVLKVGTWFVG